VSPFATGQFQAGSSDELMKKLSGLISESGDSPTPAPFSSPTGTFATSDMLVSVQLAMYI
jgi:hypothetical protein